MKLVRCAVLSAAVVFAVTATLPALAQTSSTPITGDRMPTADQLPPKPAKADRKAARKAAREARRPEAEAAARNQDFSGGVYNPAKPRPQPKPAPKAPSAP